MELDKYKLCYIDENWAYFTTQDLDKQWGDDWNDAPYEHNAGTPYVGSQWEIKRIAFDGPFKQPCDSHYSSPYSVEMINSGTIAWLHTEKYASKQIVIPAGTTLPEFIEMVKSVHGGEVYLPEDITNV